MIQYFHQNVWQGYNFPTKFTIAFEAEPRHIEELAVCLENNVQTHLKLGVARCNPIDNFCKKTGREVATAKIAELPFHVESIFKDKTSLLVLFTSPSLKLVCRFRNNHLYLERAV